MTLNSRHAPYIFSAVCGCLALAVTSVLPIWPFGNECDRPLWVSAPEFYSELRAYSPSRDGLPVLLFIHRHYWPLPLLAMGVLCGGWLLGRLWYWQLWEKG